MALLGYDAWKTTDPRDGDYYSEEDMSEMTVIEPEETALAPRPAGIVKPAGNVGEAVSAYREVQRALDKAMPDCIMQIQGKPFRKKNYWRGVATAFNLDVECVGESEREDEWLVTYRATAPNGRKADGDGTCSMQEKSGKMATTHNVRAHAHTRAFNRAVSNLVGFGEVSAEEVGSDGEPVRPQQRRQQSSGGTSGAISDKQAKRLYAITAATAERLDIPKAELEARVKGWLHDLGFESSRQLTKDPYDRLCERLESLTAEDLNDEPVDAELI